MEKQQKKRVPYFRLYFKSFARFFKNPVLLLPSLFQLLMFLGLALVVALEFILLALVNGSANLVQPVFPVTAVNLLIMAVFITLDFLLLNIAFTYPAAMRIGMIKEVLDQGKTSRNNMLAYGKQYFNNYFKYCFMLLAIELVTVLATLIFQNPRNDLSLNLTFHFADFYGLFVGMLLFSIILGFLYWIFELIFLFFDPVLVQKNESSGFMGIIKHLWSYVNKHPFHLIITWVMIWIVTAGLPIVIENLVGYVENELVSLGLFILLLILLHIIDLIMRIFIFHAYFHHQEPRE